MLKLIGSRFVKASTLVLGVALWSAPTFGQAQPPGGAGREGRGGGTDEERQQRFEQFRQQIESRMKEVLKASDEEFAVLRPRIEKIQQTQRANDTRRLAFGMLMNNNSNWRTRASDPGAGQRQENNRETNNRRTSPFGETPTTPVVTKSQELQAALEAKDASPEVLKTKLAELRAAREQSKAELTRLQEELRQLCSIRQESVLVMMGILE